MNEQERQAKLATADGQYATVRRRLDEIVKSIQEDENFIKMTAGTFDTSTVFDYVYWVVKSKNRMQPGAMMVTEAICAAALTKLACAPHAEPDPLAQYEKELNRNDDDY